MGWELNSSATSGPMPPPSTGVNVLIPINGVLSDVAALKAYGTLQKLTNQPVFLADPLGVGFVLDGGLLGTEDVFKLAWIGTNNPILKLSGTNVFDAVKGIRGVSLTVNSGTQTFNGFSLAVQSDFGEIKFGTNASVAALNLAAINISCSRLQFPSGTTNKSVNLTSRTRFICHNIDNTGNSTNSFNIASDVFVSTIQGEGNVNITGSRNVFEFQQWDLDGINTLNVTGINNEIRGIKGFEFIVINADSNILSVLETENLTLNTLYSDIKIGKLTSIFTTTFVSSKLFIQDLASWDLIGNCSYALSDIYIGRLGIFDFQDGITFEGSRIYIGELITSWNLALISDGFKNSSWEIQKSNVNISIVSGVQLTNFKFKINQGLNFSVGNCLGAIIEANVLDQAIISGSNITFTSSNCEILTLLAVTDSIINCAYSLEVNFTDAERVNINFCNVIINSIVKLKGSIISDSGINNYDLPLLSDNNRLIGSGVSKSGAGVNNLIF